MSERKVYRARAKAARIDRRETVAVSAFLLLIAGLLIGQLLLLISP